MSANFEVTHPRARRYLQELQGAQAPAMKFMLITNDPVEAANAIAAGIPRIFVDMEYEGKRERQAHLGAHFAGHSLEDVAAVRGAIPQAELLVRCNPYSPRTAEEIENIIALGADVVMLPMFRSEEDALEVQKIIRGRVRLSLLVETPQALARLRNILRGPARPDEVYLGLNDLSLGMGLSFLFEPLSGGLVDHFCNEARSAGIPYGFGGIGALGNGDIPAGLVLSEHVRLGSSIVILSRAFRNVVRLDGILDRDLMTREMEAFSAEHGNLSSADAGLLEDNRRTLVDCVNRVNARNAEARRNAAAAAVKEPAPLILAFGW